MWNHSLWLSLINYSSFIVVIRYPIKSLRISNNKMIESGNQIYCAFHLLHCFTSHTKPLPQKTPPTFHQPSNQELLRCFSVPCIAWIKLLFAFRILWECDDYAYGNCMAWLQWLLFDFRAILLKCWCYLGWKESLKWNF